MVGLLGKEGVEGGEERGWMGKGKFLQSADGGGTEGRGNHEIGV